MQKTKIIEVKERFMAGVDQNTILTIMQDTIDQRDYERLRESLLSSNIRTFGFGIRPPSE